MSLSDYTYENPGKTLMWGLAILVVVFFVGSFIKTSEGDYYGKSVQVQWKGLVFKSCEIDVQMGDQSSTLGYCSSFDKNLCNELKKSVGQNKKHIFENTLTSGFTRNTSCLIKEIK